MEKKRIYFVQPNSQYGDSIYFPYAAGTIAAYAFDDAEVCEKFSIGSFLYKRTSVAEALALLSEPDIVAFSCYVWNYEFNKAVAAAVKQAYPDCITVFGGHQINSRNDAAKEDFADYIILGEGEEPFRRLLLAIANNEEPSDIPNLIYKRNEEVIHTPQTDLAAPYRASPYLAGYFDEMVKTETLKFSAILETNRGCPNKCAFCDWGYIKSKVRMFPQELSEKEIDWMAENKIEYCYCADANFGLFPRDEEITEFIIAKNRETGYPQKFQATYSKNNPETVFRINKKLNDAGMSKGATLSFQSMSESVLKNIFRKNIPLDSFYELIRLYRQNNISAYSELILGLPGESYESFKQGFELLLEHGQHMSIDFFNCEMLANSIMSNPDYIKKYGIETTRTQQHQYHTLPTPPEVAEFSEIVVATDSMTREMWMNCNVLAVFIRALHNLGLLQCFAIYLYHEKGVQYTDFYERLIEHAQNLPQTMCGEILIWKRGKYSEILNGAGSLTDFDEAFGNLTWPLDESMFLKIVKDPQRFYSEITPFLKEYFDDPELFGELLEYQKAIVKTPREGNITLELKHDLFAYFSEVYSNSHVSLETKTNRILIHGETIPKNLVDYAREVVWYGRKGGQHIIGNVEYLA